MKRRTRYRWLPALAGLLLTAASGALYAGRMLPYQDPTADMLARQAVQVKNASMLLIISLLVLAGGVVFAFIARPKESKTDRER